MDYDLTDINSVCSTKTGKIAIDSTSRMRVLLLCSRIWRRRTCWESSDPNHISNHEHVAIGDDYGAVHFPLPLLL